MININCNDGIAGFSLENIAAYRIIRTDNHWSLFILTKGGSNFCEVLGEVTEEAKMELENVLTGGGWK